MKFGSLFANFKTVRAFLRYPNDWFSRSRALESFTFPMETEVDREPSKVRPAASHGLE